MLLFQIHCHMISVMALSLANARETQSNMGNKKGQKELIGQSIAVGFNCPLPHIIFMYVWY